MTHMHITSWALALILFIIALVLYNQGKEKPGKILHMILRVFYLLILFTGVDLLVHYFGGGEMGALLPEAVVKGLAGIWVIAAMEMVLVRNNKGKSVKGAWIQLIIAFLITLILGFWRLPM